MQTDISVFVSSCDKYEHLWQGFADRFNEHFKPELDRYLLSETKPAKNGFVPLLGGKGSFSSCLRNGLKQVPTPYVFFFLEDYWLKDSLSVEELERHLSFVKEKDIDRLGVHGPSMYYTIDCDERGYRKFSPESQYPYTLQTSIWKKDFFISLLDSERNPWEFELHTPYRPSNIWYHEKDWYWNVLHRGQFSNEYRKSCGLAQ